MIKRAFTLVEVLVSVALLGLISMFVVSTVTQTKNNNRLFENKINEDKKLETLSDLLYDDLSLSQDVTVQGLKKYSVLHVKGENSIYGIEEPFVVWLVLKDKNMLVRMESARKITLPLKEEMKKYVFIDALLGECEHFNINMSKDKKSILSFVQIQDKKPIIFEVEKL